MREGLSKRIKVPAGSKLSRADYARFLQEAFELLRGQSLYLADDEDINCLELAHLIPSVPQTLLAVYLSINDAVCNKGLVSPFLLRHGHNNVFVFDPQEYSGGDDVPGGCIDAGEVLNGFEPPNESWDAAWTYVMIEDPGRDYRSLWTERGYIDTIPAKFEDFTLMSGLEASRICFFVDRQAFEHPVNKGRSYLARARRRGAERYDEFEIPAGLEGETEGLEPVILRQGEKLYIATTNFGPCAHAWSNLHGDNETYAVVNENSAVPLELVLEKPVVDKKYADVLKPAKGSADMTTDWFYRGGEVSRVPLLSGAIKG